MSYNVAAIKARENAGLTVRELAEKAGFDYMTLYHFENNKRACKITTVMKFADVLGISLDEYLGRKIPLSDIEKAINFFKEQIIKTELIPDSLMDENYKEQLTCFRTALIALERYEKEGDV